MGEPARHHTINYIEIAVAAVDRAKTFYNSVFGWNFTDYGPDYASFSAENAGIDGGLRTANASRTSAPDEPLIVLYSEDLDCTQAGILAAGGAIVVPTFEFPGGRRFHFSDGVGNVLAVWSE